MKKHGYSRAGALLSCLALLMGLMAVPAGAAGNGAYTAATTTYYVNPDTGSTDDSGGDASTAIGEGMCRSVLGKTALVEIEDDTVWITLRVLLLSNLKSLKFEVQKTAGDAESYAAVEPDIMAEHTADDAADYRFEVPSADSYVRCTAYVIPMSRDVVFYLNASGSLKSGGGDFVVSVAGPAAGESPVPSPTPKAAATPSPQPSQTPAPLPVPTAVGTPSPAPAAEAPASPDLPAAGAAPELTAAASPSPSAAGGDAAPAETTPAETEAPDEAPAAAEPTPQPAAQGPEEMVPSDAPDPAPEETAPPAEAQSQSVTPVGILAAVVLVLAVAVVIIVVKRKK